jgi:hypothetical protein
MNSVGSVRLHAVRGAALRAGLALGVCLALSLQGQTLPGKTTTSKLTAGLQRLVAPAAKAATAGPVQISPAPVPTRNGLVALDAVASGDPKVLLADLQALGLKGGATRGRLVSGLLPVGKVSQLAGLKSLKLARPAYRATHAGLVTSQGDHAQGSDVARATHGVTGSGIKVGVLSDSFDALGGAASDILTDDLPRATTVLSDYFDSDATDEGRAMMQIVHDVAPGSPLLFHTAWIGDADFAQGILELAAAGCKVIVDDVIYYAEPMFQDGIIAQAVDQVAAMGVSYFSSAGNEARDSYEAPYAESGWGYHDFDPGAGVDIGLTVTFQPGITYIVLQWQDPFYSVSGAPGAATDLDFGLFDMDGNSTGIGSWDWNAGADPVEILGVEVTGGPLQLQIAISHWSGPLPGQLKMVWFGDMTVDEYATDSSTCYGHPNAAGAEAVGAARYTKTPPWGVTPPLLEYFSSAGGTPIYFDTAGNPVGPILRAKPGIVAPDGGDTTFFWYGSDPDGTGWPNFFGTSAAAPHAAGIAALMLQKDPTWSPAAIYGMLEQTAIDMDTAGFDYNTGWGFVQADDAVYLALPRPDLTVPLLDHASPTLVARYLAAGTAYVRCQQANVGKKASNACTLRFWLSSDAVLDAGDQSLATVAVKALAAGARTTVQNTSLRLGRRLASGETAYIIAEVDDGHVVDESAESNNTAVLKLTMP